MIKKDLMKKIHQTQRRVKAQMKKKRMQLLRKLKIELQVKMMPKMLEAIFSKMI